MMWGDRGGWRCLPTRDKLLDIFWLEDESPIGVQKFRLGEDGFDCFLK